MLDHRHSERNDEFSCEAHLPQVDHSFGGTLFATTDRLHGQWRRH
ncbi:MAG: hypothetical protein AVDCRST_MAG43-617 [uncultured Thermomicrobiales bacterium]|uniref:Uncharacterized protein n=1 Tax=uncultured Thermomicrobiales bacterium TaxID=1645740 RepID=A0A6J4UEH8_9BACT|nr:MAG: hypothetical protein AVDCRST_MAG43-617 [uncultured Thermomicrobiales bacterium]